MRAATDFFRDKFIAGEFIEISTRKREEHGWSSAGQPLA